jgi:DNA (cytosine-5)-methyltransferase 1
VDIFAGAGGFSMAAISAGFNVRMAIENDPYAIKTYAKNICEKLLSSTVLIAEDITKIDAAAVTAQCFGQEEVCDLLLGGPPCQGFSTHRIKDSGVNDKRNELVLTYFEFVKSLRPTAFLIENVPGMLWPRHRQFIELLYSEGRKTGYRMFDPVTLDARDFGVPQRRKRVFILGIFDRRFQGNFEWPPKSTHGNMADCLNDKTLKPWVNCASAFRPSKADDPNNLHMNHSAELMRVFEKTPPNGGSRKDSGRVLPCHKDHDGHKDVYGRIDPKLPGPTMTTACINPSKGRFVHPVEHHGITVRQAARMQTFPDWFHFEGGLTNAGKQVGNAVPVEFGAALIRHIKDMLISGRDIAEQNRRMQKAA